MKKIRTIQTILLVMVLPCMAMTLPVNLHISAGNLTSLIIKQKSGNETILSLDTNPVITFEGDNLMVKNNLTVSYL